MRVQTCKRATHSINLPHDGLVIAWREATVSLEGMMSCFGKQQVYTEALLRRRIGDAPCRRRTAEGSRRCQNMFKIHIIRRSVGHHLLGTKTMKIVKLAAQDIQQTPCTSTAEREVRPPRFCATAGLTEGALYAATQHRSQYPCQFSRKCRLSFLPKCHASADEDSVFIELTDKRQPVVSRG